jgi:hypothetical protein
MAGTMYFQWQNEVLLKTIYPLRQMKLRDFLVYYKEIDLWAEYKDKKVADLQSEIKAYIDAREYALVTAYKSYKTQYAYFTQPDVRSKYMAKYKLTDETELTKLKELHQTFISFLPKYADVRKERAVFCYAAGLFMGTAPQKSCPAGGPETAQTEHHVPKPPQPADRKSGTSETAICYSGYCGGGTRAPVYLCLDLQQDREAQTGIL